LDEHSSRETLPNAVDRRTQHRQPIDEWLKDKRFGVVLAGAGLGKSTFLRFLALDILSDHPRFGTLGALHKNRLPVWIPFGFWTALVADNSTAQPSIEDVVQRWLHHLACDHLWPDVKAAMADERLLLLVDELDEYRSESAAGLARRQLQVFMEMRKCPTIVTSRPVGYQRLPALSGEWATGTLAESRQISNAHLPRHGCSFGSQTPSREPTSRLYLSERLRTSSDSKEIARSPGLQELAGIPLLLGILIYLNSSSLPLPRTRFQAYRRMVDHLIADHPRARQLAASVRDGAPTFSPEDLRSILAALAFRTSTDKPEEAIERADALKII
jgi:hypothetical protein